MEKFMTIDEYLNELNQPEKDELNRIRNLVKEIVPDAVETISYGMPGFKYKGKYMLGFAAFKDHLSLFPTSIPTELLKSKLVEYKTSKGTIQFTVKNPLSEELIREIVKIRIDSING